MNGGLNGGSCGDVRVWVGAGCDVSGWLDAGYDVVRLLCINDDLVGLYAVLMTWILLCSRHFCTYSQVTTGAI